MELPSNEPQEEDVQISTEEYEPQSQYRSSKAGVGVLGKVKNLPVNKILIGLVLLLQLGIIVLIVLIVDPEGLYDEYKDNRLKGKVEDLVEVSGDEDPSISVIIDIDTLLSGHEINEEVYKDAQNDDYILSYSDKIVIYRESTNKVIYEGDPPGTILAKRQQAALDSLVELAKAQGLVTDETAVSPQVSIVTDPELLQAQSETFYALALEGDYVVYFPNAETILIYRPDTDEIIKIGTYRTEIK